MTAAAAQSSRTTKTSCLVLSPVKVIVVAVLVCCFRHCYCCSCFPKFLRLSTPGVMIDLSGHLEYHVRMMGDLPLNGDEGDGDEPGPISPPFWRGCRERCQR